MIHSGAQILNGILQDQAQTLSRGLDIPLPTGVHHLAAQLVAVRPQHLEQQRLSQRP